MDLTHQALTPTQLIKWNKKLLSLCFQLVKELSGYKAQHPEHDEQLINRARRLLSHHSVTEAPSKDLLADQPTQWFFYSGFERLNETERAYFCGSYKPNRYKMPGCIEKAVQEIAEQRNCSEYNIYLTAFTPLP